MLDSLKQLNIELEIKPMVWPDMVASTKTPATTADFFPVYQTGNYADPDNVAYAAYHSSRNGNWQNPVYKNPKVDELIVLDTAVEVAKGLQAAADGFRHIGRREERQAHNRPHQLVEAHAIGQEQRQHHARHEQHGYQRHAAPELNEGNRCGADHGKLRLPPQRQQDAVLVIKNTFVSHNQISSWLTVAAKVATFVCPANQGHADNGTEHDGDVDEAVEYERVHTGTWRNLIHHDEEEANQNARN